MWSVWGSYHSRARPPSSSVYPPAMYPAAGFLSGLHAYPVVRYSEMGDYTGGGVSQWKAALDILNQ